MSPVWAIVPVRALAGGKSRLAGALTPQARAALCREMLARVLAAVTATPEVAATLVVSPDPEARALASGLGAETLAERGGVGLNGALAQAAAAAQARGAGAALVVAADLPLLRPGELSALLRAAASAAVVVAPDRAGTGTNLLYLRPPDAIPFHFEGASRDAHLSAARQAGLAARVFTAPGTATDIDTPADLAAWREGATA